MQMNPVTGEVIGEMNELWVYPATTTSPGATGC